MNPEQAAGERTPRPGFGLSIGAPDPSTAGFFPASEELEPESSLSSSSSSSLLSPPFLLTFTTPPGCIVGKVVICFLAAAPAPFLKKVVFAVFSYFLFSYFYIFDDLLFYF